MFATRATGGGKGDRHRNGDGCALTASDGTPGIDLFNVSHTISDDYLTDGSLAGGLVGLSDDIQLKGSSSADVPTTDFALTPDGAGRDANFLFEGISAGSGQVTVEFDKNGVAVATDSIYLRLQSVQDMFETYQVGNSKYSYGSDKGTNAAPDLQGYNWPDPKTDPAAYSSYQMVGQSPYGTSTTATSKYVVMVHGWRMLPWEKDYYASTAYKRLFWQGYKGRFAALDWPTEWFNSDQNIVVTAATESLNFDQSEEKAYYSASALQSLLTNLDAKVGYQNVNLFAHSMGNVVASEALRISGEVKLVHTYVASQAATVAEAYNPNAPKTLFTGIFGEAGPDDSANPASLYASFPSTGRGYFQDINKAADSLYNFYNPVDYALYDDFIFGPTTWRLNQASKPDDKVPDAAGDVDYGWSNGSFVRKQYTYSIDKNGQVNRVLVSTTALNMGIQSDVYEAFSYAAEPRSQALGAQPGIGGPFTGGVNMQLTFGFTDAQDDHSAEFLSTYAARAKYWKTLLNEFGVPHNQ